MTPQILLSPQVTLPGSTSPVNLYELSIIFIVIQANALCTHLERFKDKKQ